MTQKLKNRKVLGMRTKLFIYLVVFVLILLAVIALFQTVLLPMIYKITVREQTVAAVNKIASVDASSESFETNVYDVASKYHLCISVYLVGDNEASEIVNAHTSKFCLIHMSMNNSYLVSELYSSAKDKNIYIEDRELQNSSSDGNLLAAKIVSMDESSEILIISNSEIEPIDTTVTTLRYELVIISVILILVALGVSVFISRKLTHPVIQMNEEAKKLARGDYDVNFDGGSFRETAELGSTLNYASKELSKLDTMQKELISNISHDLRTPLTLISGYSEVMRDIPGEMTKENMQVIIDESARLTSLVNDMLDLSRISGGKRELKITTFSLTECVKKTVDRYSHLTSNEGYSIEFNFEEDIFVEADETLVLQVIYNLISNAVNYTGDDKKVYITQTIENNICRISVTDTGDGIDEEKLPLIWDRYYRTGDFHKRAVTGTGLGLSIVKNALVLHNADFGVISKNGEGATFWFELKISDKG